MAIDPETNSSARAIKFQTVQVPTGKPPSEKAVQTKAVERDAQAAGIYNDLSSPVAILRTYPNGNWIDVFCLLPSQGVAYPSDETVYLYVIQDTFSFLSFYDNKGFYYNWQGRFPPGVNTNLSTVL
ncbi:hypothetical protein [Hyalangium versicolor]|uniref:hypothetical protein n=1 Tax=Hyalangium versicolor TaxID=2861190 RepID=UPI001CCB4EBE|nr:hypothetical protein [Hyalangium versicolor]